MSRDDEVRGVMEASRTEEEVPSALLRSMGMKVIAARDERDRLEDAILRALDQIVGWCGQPTSDPAEIVRRLRSILEETTAQQPEGIALSHELQQRGDDTFQTVWAHAFSLFPHITTGEYELARYFYLAGESHTTDPAEPAVLGG